MNRQRSGVWRFVFRSKNPDAAGRGNDSGKQQIRQESALGGIGTGSDCPATAVPMQKKGHLMFRSIAGKVRSECPNIVCGVSRQAKQAVRLIHAVRANIGTRHHGPACAVIVFD